MMSCKLFPVLLLVAFSAVGYAIPANKNEALPVVYWHGMGDSCCNPVSIGHFVKLTEEETGQYVTSLNTGKQGFISDTLSGFLRPVNEQIQAVCETLAADPKLQNGYNSIGISQGGQFLRAVAQRCPHPPMKKLISIGGQHQGVYGIPNCLAENSKLCDGLRKMATSVVYSDPIQSGLVQAQYWHDPLDNAQYVEKSQFIAEINNEPPYSNASYAENLSKLDKMVLVMFDEDSMVQPKQSSHFGFYAEGNGVEVQSLQETSLYTEDRLGLQKMDKAGKIDFVTIPGDHLQFSEQWFIEDIIRKYLV